MVVWLLKLAILMLFGAKNRTDPGRPDVRDYLLSPASTKLPLAALPAFEPVHTPRAGSRFRWNTARGVRRFSLAGVRHGIPELRTVNG